MAPWDDHDHWMEELRKIIGSDIEGELDDDDVMFVSNIAAHLKHGEIGIPEALHEIHKWAMHKMGFLGVLDKESFELELQVNHPHLIDITAAFKENMRIADEPGIADGVVQIFADPAFEMFNAEGSAVAIQSKAWLRLEALTPAEHTAMGWAIVMAVKERNDAN